MGGSWNQDMDSTYCIRSTIFICLTLVGTDPIAADPLFSRWIYDWTSTLQFIGEDRVVFDLCGRPNSPFTTDSRRILGYGLLVSCHTHHRYVKTFEVFPIGIA